MLENGQWIKKSIITRSKKGSYERVQRSFRSQIQPHGPHQPSSGRYHLYVSYACPWAHRTLIMRQLKSLESHIDVSVVHPILGENSWTFDQNFAGSSGDRLYQKQYLYQIYQMADPTRSATVTVPILWGKELKTIVNNESSEIIRQFNSSFNSLSGNNDNYYPEDLAAEINRLNDIIYNNVNNGVYRCGFASSQLAYDQAANALFATFDELDEHLSNRDYLVGHRLTEADIRLIPTLLRFDPIYAIHFKCSYRRIQDYPNLAAYTERLLTRHPAIYETTHMDHIITHYYRSHPEINPYGIIPLLQADETKKTADEA